jgi:hypothetical protein
MSLKAYLVNFFFTPFLTSSIFGFSPSISVEQQLNLPLPGLPVFLYFQLSPSGS